MDNPRLNVLFDMLRILNDMVSDTHISYGCILVYIRCMEDFIKLSGLSCSLGSVGGLYHLFDDAGRLLI